MRVLALAALLGLSACSMLAPNRSVTLSTNPPGATVRLDGHNIGFVTPCQVQLDIDEDVRLDFEVPGFRPETRYLTADDAVYSILWREMNVGPQTWNFPLFLPLGDLLAPVKWTEGHAPGRIHVELDRLSDEGTRSFPSPSTSGTRNDASGTVPPSDAAARAASEPSAPEPDAPKPEPKQ